LFCSKCGAENNYDDSFCQKCGSRIINATNSNTAVTDTNNSLSKKGKSSIRPPTAGLKQLSNIKSKPTKQAIIIASICLITILVILVIIFVINPYVMLKTAKTQALQGEYDAASKTLTHLDGDEAFALWQYIKLRKTMIQAEKEPAAYQQDHIDEARGLISTIKLYEASLDGRFISQTNQISLLLDTIELEFAPVNQYLTELKTLDNILNEIITELNRIRDGGTFTVAEVRSNVESWLQSSSEAGESANALYQSILRDSVESVHLNKHHVFGNDINNACDFLLARMNDVQKEGKGVDTPSSYTDSYDWIYWDLDQAMPSVVRATRRNLKENDHIWSDCHLHKGDEHDIYSDNFSEAEDDIKNHILTAIISKINKINENSSTELELENDLSAKQSTLDNTEIDVDFDTIPQDSNEPRGNTVGNIANGGLVAQEGEWIYFLGGYDAGKPGIYRMRTDGSSKSEIFNSNAKYLNVVDGWIYCVIPVKDLGDLLYKIRTDGSEYVMLTDPSDSPLARFRLNYVNVVDDWVYFHGDSGNGRIYKVRTDGTEGTLLSQNDGMYTNVADGWIYYSVRKYGIERMYKMRTDGSEITELCDEYGRDVNVVNEWIYYSVRDGEYDRVFKMRTDGSEKTKLSDDGRGLNVINGWIYYSNEDGLNKMRTDGSDAVKLSDNTNSGIYVMDGWIYYYIDRSLYRMRIDGSEQQVLD